MKCIEINRGEHSVKASPTSDWPKSVQKIGAAVFFGSPKPCVLTTTGQTEVLLPSKCTVYIYLAAKILIDVKNYPPRLLIYNNTQFFNIPPPSETILTGRHDHYGNRFCLLPNHHLGLSLRKRKERRPFETSFFCFSGAYGVTDKKNRAKDRNFCHYDKRQKVAERTF
ncbi:MAG: hypothetical protein SOU82_05905 [Alloprevotella sp.]|nr:hypothetical protein [Alloprevotella sp.]